MTSEGLGEMVAGDFGGTCRQISTCVDGGTSGPVKRGQQGVRTPIGASRNLSLGVDKGIGNWNLNMKLKLTTCVLDKAVI